MRMFKSYSFSNFQIWNTILLTIVIMPYTTSPAFICLITRRGYLQTTFTHFFHLSTLPRQPSSCSPFLRLVFTDFTCKWWAHTVFLFLCLTYFTSAFLFAAFPENPGLNIPAHEFPFQLCAFYFSTVLLFFFFSFTD